jgi:hypothetical protein
MNDDSRKIILRSKRSSTDKSITHNNKEASKAFSSDGHGTSSGVGHLKKSSTVPPLPSLPPQPPPAVPRLLKTPSSLLDRPQSEMTNTSTQNQRGTVIQEGEKAGGSPIVCSKATRSPKRKLLAPPRVRIPKSATAINQVSVAKDKAKRSSPSKYLKNICGGAQTTKAVKETWKTSSRKDADERSKSKPPSAPTAGIDKKNKTTKSRITIKQPKYTRGKDTAKLIAQNGTSGQEGDESGVSVGQQHLGSIKRRLVPQTITRQRVSSVLKSPLPLARPWSAPISVRFADQAKQECEKSNASSPPYFDDDITASPPESSTIRRHSQYSTPPPLQRKSPGSAWTTPESVRAALLSSTKKIGIGIGTAGTEDLSFLNSSVEDDLHDGEGDSTLLVSPLRPVAFEISNLSTVLELRKNPTRRRRQRQRSSAMLYEIIQVSVKPPPATCPARLQEDRVEDRFAAVWHDHHRSTHRIYSAVKQSQAVSCQKERRSQKLKFPVSTRTTSGKAVGMHNLTPPPRTADVLTSPTALFLSPNLYSRFHDIEDTANIPILEFNIIALESKVNDLQEQVESKDTRIEELEQKCSELHSNGSNTSVAVINLPEPVFQKPKNGESPKENFKAELSLLEEQVTQMNHGFESLPTENKNIALQKQLLCRNGPQTEEPDAADMACEADIEFVPSSKLSKTERDLEAARKTADGATREASRIAVDNKILRQQLFEQNKILEQTNDICHDVEANLAAKEKELLAARKQDCSRVAIGEKMLHQQLLEQNKIVEQTNAICQDVEGTLAAKEKELAARNQDWFRIAAENKMLHQQLLEQTKILDQTNTICQDVEADLAAKENEVAARYQEWSQILNQKVNKNEVLQQQLSDQDSIIQQTDAICQEVEANLTTKEEVLVSTRRSCSFLTSENAALKVQIAEQDAKHNVETDNLTAKEKILVSTRQNCSFLGSENAALRLEMAEQDAKRTLETRERKMNQKDEIRGLRKKLARVITDHARFKATTTKELEQTHEAMENAYHQILEHVKEEVQSSAETVVDYVHDHQQKRNELQHLKDKFSANKVHKLESDLYSAKEEARSIQQQADEEKTVFSLAVQSLVEKLKQQAAIKVAKRKTSNSPKATKTTTLSVGQHITSYTSTPKIENTCHTTPCQKHFSNDENPLLSPIPTMESWQQFTTRFQLALQGEKWSSSRSSPLKYSKPPAPPPPSNMPPLICHSLDRTRARSCSGQKNQRNHVSSQDRRTSRRGMAHNHERNVMFKNLMSELSFERMGTSPARLAGMKSTDTVETDKFSDCFGSEMKCDNEDDDSLFVDAIEFNGPE